MSNLHQAVYQVASNIAILKEDDSLLASFLEAHQLSPNELASFKQILLNKSAISALFCSNELGQKVQAIFKDIEELWVPDAEKK